jgi:hypothetical protein
MIKNEIKRFKLNVGSSSVDCEIPASVYSLSLEDTAEFISGGGCSFDSDVAVTVAEKQSKYAFLKISGIYANAEVFFNGKSYGMTTSCDRTYYFDITDGIKLLRDYENTDVSEYALKLAREVIEFEERNLERAKKYI